MPGVPCGAEAALERPTGRTSAEVDADGGTLACDPAVVCEGGHSGHLVVATGGDCLASTRRGVALALVDLSGGLGRVLAVSWWVGGSCRLALRCLAWLSRGGRSGLAAGSWRLGVPLCVGTAGGALVGAG